MVGSLDCCSPWCYRKRSERNGKMTEHRKDTPLKTYRMAALAVILGLTGALSYAFARAVSDSREWRLVSEQALVSPTYLPQDPKQLKQIPDFTLKDRNGRSVRLSQFAEVDLLIVNIWATNCPACEAELPSLEEMDRRLASYGKVALITITTDEKWSDVAHLFPKGTDLRILFDPEEKVTNGLFGTSRFPETFILDKRRRVRARFDGQRPWHTDEMLRYLTAFE